VPFPFSLSKAPCVAEFLWFRFAVYSPNLAPRPFLPPLYAQERLFALFQLPPFAYVDSPFNDPVVEMGFPLISSLSPVENETTQRS